jgi:hypothetical protein
VTQEVKKKAMEIGSIYANLNRHQFHMKGKSAKET